MGMVWNHQQSPEGTRRSCCKFGKRVNHIKYHRLRGYSRIQNNENHKKLIARVPSDTQTQLRNLAKVMATTMAHQSHGNGIAKGCNILTISLAFPLPLPYHACHHLGPVLI